MLTKQGASNIAQLVICLRSASKELLLIRECLCEECKSNLSRAIAEEKSLDKTREDKAQ